MLFVTGKIVSEDGWNVINLGFIPTGKKVYLYLTARLPLDIRVRLTLGRPPELGRNVRFHTWERTESCIFATAVVRLFDVTPGKDFVAYVRHKIIFKWFAIEDAWPLVPCRPGVKIIQLVDSDSRLVYTWI